MYELGQELLMLDAAARTNLYGHMPTVLLLRDEWGNGLPVGLMICSSEQAVPTPLLLDVMASAASRSAGGQRASQQSLAKSAQSLHAPEQSLRSSEASEQPQPPAAIVAKAPRFSKG